MHWTPADRRFMDMAFSEASRVKGRTLPNPAVGAVLVNKGKVVGKGGTRPAGSAHAEIVALNEARENAVNATLYVTLEPCCHDGKTPPCTKALIAAGVKKIIVSCPDPNPRVSGKGLVELRRAGIEVQTGLFEERARDFYEGFFFYITHGRPKIIVKIAQSLDGRINERSGIPAEITGVEALRHSHAMRTRADAILIGGGTLRSDDPDLTPRLVPGPAPDALVLTRKKKLDPRYRLFSTNRASETLVLSGTRGKIQGLPSFVRQMHLRPQKSDKALARSLIEVFLEKGYHMVLVEGGRSVWAPFLNAGLCDVFCLFTGPKLLPKGERWDENLRPGWVKTLDFHRFTPFGSDVLAEFYNVHRNRSGSG